MHRILVVALLALLVPASSAGAATLTVNTTADVPDISPGDGVCSGGPSVQNRCTLRAALGEANALAGSDNVTLPAGTYSIDAAQGQLAVGTTVTVNGAGARTTVLQGTGGGRVMNVTANLTLRDVTITGGSPSGSGMTLGGGLLIGNGDVTLERVVVRNNAVASQTHARGGGIAVIGGSLTLLSSTVSGNTAIGQVAASSGGSAAGGGLYTEAPTTVRRSTITGNVTRSIGAGQYSTGGGVHASEFLTLDHVTLTDNHAAVVGASSGFRMGGGLSVGSGVSAALSRSILAGNTATTGGNCYSNGTVTETAKNLSDTSDCLGAASVRNADPKLGALADNGGPTDTRIPAAGSPVINGAPGCGILPNDQRGNALPAGPACDFGAVEVGADRGVTLQPSKTAAAAGEDVTLIATITNAGADDATGETLTIELPAGATATTATSTLGACTGGASVTCALGALNDGAAATIIATVRASGDAMAITARRGGPIPDPQAGNDSAAVSLTGVAPVVPQPGGGTQQPGGGGSGVGPAGDTSGPLVSGLTLAKKPTVRRGATVKFRISEAAKVRIVVERKVKKTYKRVTTKTAQVKKAGAVSVKLSGKALKAGKLRFTVVATDAAGNVSRTARVTKTIRKR